MCLQTASADDLNITDADAIINLTPCLPLDDVLDSTDATPQDKFNDIFVHQADFTVKIAACTPDNDILDSTDATPQDKFNDIFVHQADFTVKIVACTPDNDILDSTDATPQDKFNDIFVHLADSTMKIAACTPPDNALDSLPEVTSCDLDSIEKNEFKHCVNVFVKAEELQPNTDYSIWIQEAQINDGDILDTDKDPSGSQETITTDAIGKFGRELIWSIPANEPMAYQEYDIIVDKLNDGINTSRYNFASDGIDSSQTLGFAVHRIYTDIDGNNIVNILDVRLLMNHISDPAKYQIDGWVGDIDYDDDIDTDDVELLVMHVFDPDAYPLNCE